MNRRLFLTCSLLLAAGLGAVLVSCGKPPAEPTAKAAGLRTVVVHMGWLFSGAYGGEALGAKDFAAGHGLKIELQPGGPGLDPLRLTGQGAFGVAAADEVIRAVEKGAPYLIVAVLNERSPAAFAVLEGSGISGPKDFAGKRVGILPFGSTGLIYQAMIAAAGVERASVTEVPVYPDLRPFVAGSTHDVQPVFAYDEPVTLRLQGVKFRLIKPEDYGVRFKGAVYFAHRDTVKNDPQLVRDFLATMREGWTKALAHPEQAVAALKLLEPKLDVERENAVLRAALEYYQDGAKPLFTSEPESWRPMIRTMRQYGALSREMNPDEFLALEFVRPGSP